MKVLPPEIGKLSGLTRLDLVGNRLAVLPPEIGELSRLTTLYLSDNQLTALPPEIGQLSRLEGLNLSDNQLAALPLELGRLTMLEFLDLDGNPLTSPPPEVVQQGTQAILAYLRSMLEAGVRQWVSKLLVVGEGGVGKTSLLRAHGTASNRASSTTGSTRSRRWHPNRRYYWSPPILTSATPIFL